MSKAKLTKEQRAALSDLKKKVRDMLREFSREAIANIERAEADGAGIIADHIANGENFATPKDVLCALARDMEHSYKRPFPTRRDTLRINRYYMHM